MLQVLGHLAVVEQEQRSGLETPGDIADPLRSSQLHLDLASFGNRPGVEIGPLIGALGLGGLAIALALQPVLQNLFAGVVLQTDPPAWRVVDLARKAETYGFRYGWAFDSHVLWQEPYVIFSQMLSATNRMTVGPMVTNPGTRDWTVTASHYATLNDMFGNRTICGIGRGDSAMRVLGHTPSKLSTLSECMKVIKGLAEGEEVTYNGTQQHFPWSQGSELKILMAAYGPRALHLCGSETDGFILQLRAIGRTRPLTKDIETFLFHPRFPVDVRHNAKIHREELKAWARESLA